MIVVLDTNVMISATLSRTGPPAEIIRRWHQEAFDVATSPQQLEEIRRTFAYPRVQKALKLSETELDEFLEFFRSNTIIVEPSSMLEVVSQDPDDNRIVECAVTAGARYIVSGDAHLLRLQNFQGILILQPSDFLLFLDLD